MEITLILKIIASVATFATGILALVKPGTVPGFTGLKAEGPRGISEIRSIFGGLFIALGITALFLRGITFTMMGIGYLVIALVRAFSILFDKSYDRSNWLSLGIEIVLGIVLVI